MFIEPRNEMPSIEGTGGHPIRIMRSTLVEGAFKCTLSQCIHYDNCSEIVLTWELLNPDPATFLAHTVTVPRIPGYRLWPMDGKAGQHVEENHYLVSPRLPDNGLDDLVIDVSAFGMGGYKLFELRNLTMVNLPQTEFRL